jgi:ankyrin repeat protein
MRAKHHVAPLLLPLACAVTPTWPLQVTDKSGARPFELTNDSTLRVLLGGHTLDLHIAAEEGRLKRLHKSLSKAFPVAARDAWGRTPLHLAVSAGKVSAAKALLDAGAPIDAADADGYTPLHVAAVLGRLDAAVFLLQAGASHAVRTSVKSKTEPRCATPLLLAVKSGGASLVEALLAAGADASCVDADGVSGLQAALEAEALPLVRLLLAAGADANSGHPLLIVSASKTISTTEAGRAEVLRLLLAAGADVLRVGAGGFTALAAAARVGHAAAVEVLLAAGADASQATTGGLTPLRLARVNKRDAVVALLLAAGAAETAQG